jgi:hypothetical protein
MPVMRLIAWMLVATAACSGAPPSSPDGGLDANASEDAGRDAMRPMDAGSDAGPLPSACDNLPAPSPFPAPNAWGPNTGPGGPARTFTDAERYVNCAYIENGDTDIGHHNLAVMFDGYLVAPWAPEWGGGSIAFYDVSDPCAPVRVGSTWSITMRETHAIGFSTWNGRYAVVDQLTRALLFDGGGMQFWDVSDPRNPTVVADLELPGFIYPDSYARLTLSTFWQVPYVYAGGADNGVYVVNAVDPHHPRFVSLYTFDPVLRVGQVAVIGNLLIATAAEGARTVLLDVSDPTSPQPIAGGDFVAVDSAGMARESYFSNFAGGFVYYARKDSGGGVLIMDVRDPSRPVYAGDFHSTDGNGGYVFFKNGLAFTGESHFAAIYDVRDPSAITEVQRLDLAGDLDTMTPIGNVVVLSVDEEPLPDQASAIAPYELTPDDVAPRVSWSWPNEGATGLLTTSRIGLSFDEMVDVRSAFEGSVRLYRSGGTPDEGRVPAIISAQEAIVNVSPRCPLEPDTEYTLEVPAGGVADYNGNAIETPFVLHFRTGPE